MDRALVYVCPECKLAFRTKWTEEGWIVLREDGRSGFCECGLRVIEDDVHEVLPDPEGGFELVPLSGTADI